jgi:hypothetical protein
MVKDHLTLMAAMSDHRQALYEQPKIRGRLAVADTIVLHRRQGHSNAALLFFSEMWIRGVSQQMPMGMRRHQI